MSVASFFEGVDVKPRFQARPIALPGDLRPEWRLAVLVLILASCRGQRSSLRKLHVLNWAIRSRASRESFELCLRGEGLPDEAIVRYEPALNRAIDLARGEGLVVRESGDRIQLAAKGGFFLAELSKTTDCLVEERNFLQRVGQLTEKRITELLKMGA